MAASLIDSLLNSQRKQHFHVGPTWHRSRGDRGDRGDRAAAAETAALPVQQIPSAAAGSAQCGSAFPHTEPKN